MNYERHALISLENSISTSFRSAAEKSLPYVITTQLHIIQLLRLFLFKLHHQIQRIRYYITAKDQ